MGFENPETNRIFEDEIDRLTGKVHTMGIIELVKQMRLEEAEEKGRKEGRKKAFTEKATAVVNNLLEATKFSDKKIADIAGVFEAFVKKARKKAK